MRFTACAALTLAALTLVAAAPAVDKVQPEPEGKNPAEALSEASMPVDIKPVDAKPVAKPVDAKPVEANPADVKPADVKQADVKQADVKPAEVKPAEVKPAAAPPAVITVGSNVNFTQSANITEPARNTTGLLLSIIEGSLKPFPGHLGGSASIDWKDDEHVGGGWSFGAATYGGGSGGWKFNATTFEYGGGVALKNDTTKADYLVQVNVDGSVKMTFSTSHNMKCTTKPASAGHMAKTECIMQAGDPGTPGKPKASKH